MPRHLFISLLDKVITTQCYISYFTVNNQETSVKDNMKLRHVTTA